MSREDPTLVELLESAIAAGQQRVRTLIPATVVVYDPATNLATVQPSRLRQPADGGTPTPMPTVQGPVVWPGRVGGWDIWADLLPGDPVMIGVSDRSIAEWRKTPPGTPVPALGSRMHSLTDAVIIPGLWPDVVPRANGRIPGQLYIGNASGTIKITLDPVNVTIEGPLIRLGLAATSFALKGTEVAAAFTTYTATVASAFATWGSVVPPTPISNGAFIAAVGTATATLAGSIAGWLSTKVQVQ